MSYPCTSCGQCCRQVKAVIARKQTMKPEDPGYKEISEFPYEAKPDGSCPQLGLDGKCKVYDKRPALCNIDTMYERYFKTKMSLQEWYLQNIFACNAMIINAGMHPNYFVKPIKSEE